MYARVLVNGVMSSTTPELHQTWDGSSCCYLSPSMSESMLYLWNWGDEHLKGDESPSSISTACSEAGIRQRTSQLESKRGRPRAEIISHLIVEGSTSPSAIKCTYCNRVFPREKSLQAHLRTHTGTAIFSEEKLGDKKGVAPPAKQVLIHKKLNTKDDIKCNVDRKIKNKKNGHPCSWKNWLNLGNIAKERGCDKNVCRNVNIPYVHPQVKQSKASEIESASSSLHLTSSYSSGKSVLADLESSVGPSKQELLDQASISGKIRDLQLANIQNGEQEFQTESAHILVTILVATEHSLRVVSEKLINACILVKNHSFVHILVKSIPKKKPSKKWGPPPPPQLRYRCEMRFTHANRHCPQHPFGGIHRSDDFVLRPVESNPEQSSEVLRWLERYKLEREEKTPSKTPTKITQKRYRTKKREIENENTSSPLKKPKFRKDLSNEMEQQENCSDMLESMQNECLIFFWQDKLMPFRLMYPEKQVCREL
uniref:C2H2-type domain-containing protein n=1 Tax=Timema bartmani TaxID=61472 RepID=A0A7R9F7B2_9NEOP|nr:unnamed protein product [Timema bartmani]